MPCTLLTTKLALSEIVIPSMGFKSLVRAASGHRYRRSSGRGNTSADAKKPQLDGDAEWEISNSARQFDMSRAEFGKFELTKLDAKENCCNAVISMFINSLKFQLMRLAQVIDLARTQKQFVTLDRVNCMYDWIEELQTKRFLPILFCLRDDVLPELSKVVVISEDNRLYVENRERTFEDLRVALANIIATSNAITPRLPAGERVYVLVYRYVQFEVALLSVLEEVEMLGKPQRKPARAVQKEVAMLERYMFDVLSYTAGTVPVENGGVTYDEEAAQNMRGVMTAWMKKQEVKDMRSRVGIRFFNRRKARLLRTASTDYHASKEGEFVREFEASLAADVRERQVASKGEPVNHELSKMLNRMHCMRLMEEVNGANMDLDGLELEDPSGEVVSSDEEEEGQVTLIFGNVFAPSPPSSPEAGVPTRSTATFIE